MAGLLQAAAVHPSAGARYDEHPALEPGLPEADDMNLPILLEKAREGVLAEARIALESARLQHYTASEPEENAERLRALYEMMEASARTRSVLPMVRHAERIARERHDGGFDLAEVLTAFNVLEEALWRHITKDVPPPEYPDAFGLVSTILGAGRQALALQYVSLARRTGAPALDVDALFAGV